MSDINLSEQLGRVDGAQNDILKAIVKAFGITLSNEKIDEIADLVTASGKFKQDALLSGATATLFGGDASMVPDEVLSILSKASLWDGESFKLPNNSSIPVASTKSGSYTGNDSTVIKLPVSHEMKMLFIIGELYNNMNFAIAINGLNNMVLLKGGYDSIETKGATVTFQSNFITINLNTLGAADINNSKTSYNWVAFS